MFLKSQPGISYLTQKGYWSGGFCPGVYVREIYVLIPHKETGNTKIFPAHFVDHEKFCPDSRNKKLISQKNRSVDTSVDVQIC